MWIFFTVSSLQGGRVVCVCVCVCVCLVQPRKRKILLFEHLHIWIIFRELKMEKKLLPVAKIRLVKVRQYFMIFRKRVFGI